MTYLSNFQLKVHLLLITNFTQRVLPCVLISSDEEGCLVLNVIISGPCWIRKKMRHPEICSYSISYMWVLVWHQMGLKWSISHYLGKSQIRHGTLKDITNNSSESYCFIEYAPVSVSKNPISVCHSWYKGVQLSFRIGLFINL